MSGRQVTIEQYDALRWGPTIRTIGSENNTGSADMGVSRGSALFAAGVASGAILGWLIKFPPTDSASAAGWAQAFGSLTAVGIAYWVPLRERRATEARIASDRRQLATQRAERVRSLAFDVVRLAHNGLASAESRWRNNEAAIPAADLTDLHQRISLAEQIEHNKHRIAILSGLRSLLDELKVLCEVRHVTDFVFAPDFAQRKTQWLSVVNALNDEALRAVSAAESGAAD